MVSLPSPNLRAVTPCANLVLTHEVTDGLVNTAPVPQGTSEVLSRKTGTEVLSSASHLRYEGANRAPQHALLSKSSNNKSVLHSGVRGSSLGVDSGAYAASAPKGAPRILSREAGTKALCSADRLYGNAKNEALSCASLPKPAGAKSAPANTA